MKTQIHIGFTGTQHGMTGMQTTYLRKHMEELNEIYKSFSIIFHHGDCIGADEQSHEMARELDWTIHLHPPVIVDKRAFCTPDYSHPLKPYLERNRDIVNSSPQLIGCPYQLTPAKGGTWYTINHARKLKKLVTIILPNGIILKV